MATESTEKAIDLHTFRHRWVDLLVLLPAVAAGLAGVRIYMQAGGDESTMRYLIQTLNLQAILISTFVPLIMIALLFVLGALLTSYFRAPTVDRLKRLTTTGLPPGVGPYLMLFFAWVFVAMPQPLWVAIVYSSMGGLMARRVKKERLKPASPEKAHFDARRWLLPIAVAIATLLAAAGGMWLPAETARIGTGNPSVIYVLETKEDHVTLLNKTRGIVQVVPIDAVRERTTCNEEAGQSGPRWLWRPFRDLIHGSPVGPPPCPTSEDIPAVPPVSNAPRESQPASPQPSAANSVLPNPSPSWMTPSQPSPGESPSGQ
ncbi:hypothetical protein [Asanoa iriomotensis]|uniref:Permease n=1 Tax=Asanoa iriomotensis TaxID=234613 RepID=A0ABQ4CFI6_9ACTN|nr:hypothetical protein [Asanoa iriomotensis]GIF61543.1 hypothetical protein Air01nite_76380 [Asanoa iriomotensis]